MACCPHCAAHRLHAGDGQSAALRSAGSRTRRIAKSCCRARLCAGTVARGQLQLDEAVCHRQGERPARRGVARGGTCRAIDERAAGARAGSATWFSARTAMARSAAAPAAARNTRDSSAWWCNAAFRRRRRTIKTACAKRAHRTFLRRDHQRPRPDAAARLPDSTRRPLGDRGVHSRAAAEPIRTTRRID